MREQDEPAARPLPADPADPGDLGHLTDLADLVSRLRRAMRRAARVRQPTMPLSVAQLELMSLVEEHPGARPGDLAALLRLAPNSVSTLANALLVEGMLERSAGATDRRTARLTLTSEGVRLVRQWRETNSLLLHRALAMLDADDRAVLARALPVLDRLVVHIDEQADGPP